MRKTTSEYAKPMRKLCENYEKTIAHKPSANRLAVWLAVSLAPWLLDSASQSYRESRASLVRAQRAHGPSCLGFLWFWGVPRQSIARAAAGQGGPYAPRLLHQSGPQRGPKRLHQGPGTECHLGTPASFQPHTLPWKASERAQPKINVRC